MVPVPGKPNQENRTGGFCVETPSGRSGKSCAGSSPTQFLPHPTPVALAGNAFGEKYGWSPEAAAGAEDRIVEILGALDAQLVKQQQSGSRFFIGAALTALDVHWAAFSNMVAPGDASLLPHNNPHSMPLNVFSATNTPRISKRRESTQSNKQRVGKSRAVRHDS